MTSLVSDADHWRKRVEEIRAAANNAMDDEAKEILPRIAADYTRLVERALKPAGSQDRQVL